MLEKVKSELSLVWEKVKGLSTVEKVVVGLVLVCAVALCAVCC